MSELEKVKRAKIYMDQLSRGIDPISNQTAPKEMKNERLIKCFSYISELLDKMIQNWGHIGNIINSKKYSEINYFDAALSQEPIAIKLFAKRIEEAGGMPITPVKITSWLVNEGYLKDSIGKDGKKNRSVTDKGMKLGITTETKAHLNGESYQMNFYDKQAQQFILSHLNEIIFHKSFKRYKY